jgi:hypothetical protein
MRLAPPPALLSIDAIVYGDAFDAAVASDELVRYARVRSSLDEILALIVENPALDRLVVRGTGAYALSDRPHLLLEHAARRERAGALERRGRRVSSALRHVPFVRGIALTGSAAAGNATDGADVDLLVLVDGRRLGTVFLLLGSVSRLLGRRLFCPNAYIAPSAASYDERNPYVAREIAQARTLVGRAGVLLAANAWVREIYPNVRGETPGPAPAAAGSRLQRALELPLTGRAGGRFERAARAIALKRLHAHYERSGRRVPEAVLEELARGERLSFHASGVDRTSLARYEARLGELTSLLDGMASSTTTSSIR